MKPFLNLSALLLAWATLALFFGPWIPAAVILFLLFGYGMDEVING